jgi:hypothetical protein
MYGTPVSAAAAGYVTLSSAAITALTVTNIVFEGHMTARPKIIEAKVRSFFALDQFCTHS